MDDNLSQSQSSGSPPTISASALRQLRERAQAALASQRKRVGNLEAQIYQQLDTIAQTVSEQLAEQSGDVERAEQAVAELDSLRQELDATRSAAEEKLAQSESEQCQWETQLAEYQARIDSLSAENSELDTLRQDLESTRQELDVARQEVDAARNAAESTQAELEKQRGEWESQAAEQEERVAELTTQLAQVEQKVADEQGATENNLSDLEEKLAATERERDELAIALGEAGEELNQARAAADSAVDGQALEDKFNLALEDVQRMRARVAELEQELSSRPKANQSDSAELVCLREERDDLMKLVADLERKQDTPLDVGAQQELSDLQRRFELAVEDVRELKKENAALETRLSDANKHAPASVPADNADWETLKHQLLASLESEDESGDPQAAQDRATIEGTIQITDEVVAQKDREIAELKAELASDKRPANEVVPEIDRAAVERAAEIDELLDSDEVIRQQREKLEQLQQEMEDKLRVAEMEMSIERAKIAREQSELADWRLEQEKQCEALGDGSPEGANSTPKRRWLSKLGLGGEEEE